MARLRQRIDNSHPVVQGKNLTSAQAYSDEIYFKGAWVLHSLRWVLGDEDFFTIIWRFANDPEYAYGLVSSRDLAELVFEVSGREIDWFWERYLYRAEEPVWRFKRRLDGDRDRVTIRWDDRDFEMPLPVWVDGVEQRVEMPDGRASILVDRGATLEIDPLGYVLGGPLN
jgi:aminopeptidase N